MRYKIISQNEELINKVKLIFNLLDMKEAIHIQEVDFWLVDSRTLNKDSIISYKNKIAYSHFLFITNDNEDIKECLNNGLKNYIKSNFSSDELKYWCNYFLKNPKKDVIQITKDIKLDISKSILIENNNSISLTSQELVLILELSSKNFTNTKVLANSLKVNSQTTIRTIINRIRKKISSDIFELKKGFGYKLKANDFQEDDINNIHPKKKEELEEQNKFLQNIIDSSPIFIATFIHKQLYCINKSFRDFLGNNIVKELWDKEKGDFFKLIIHTNNQKEELKDILFSKGKHQISLYNFNDESNSHFEVETLYFETLDKHLLVFKPLK